MELHVQRWILHSPQSSCVRFSLTILYRRTTYIGQAPLRYPTEIQHYCLLMLAWIRYKSDHRHADLECLFLHEACAYILGCVLTNQADMVLCLFYTQQYSINAYHYQQLVGNVINCTTHLLIPCWHVYICMCVTTALQIIHRKWKIRRGVFYCQVSFDYTSLEWTICTYNVYVQYASGSRWEE